MAQKLVSLKRTTKYDSAASPAKTADPLNRKFDERTYNNDDDDVSTRELRVSFHGDVGKLTTFT